MKGSKEEEVDRSKVAWPTLFPRHNIIDTKKADPRGPHRHKMPFYEQFTVPSHKYKPSPLPVPSSDGTTTNSAMMSPKCQPQAWTSILLLVKLQVQVSPYDSRYSYMHMMNVRVDGVGTEATATSSMNGNSARSTVVDGITDLQRVPSGGETLPLQHNFYFQSKLCKPNKKRKEDDYFAVATYSSTTQASSQRGSSSNPFEHRQGFGGGRAVQKTEVVMGKLSSACIDQTRFTRDEDSMEDDASWTSTGLECETVSAIDDVLNTLNLNYRKMVVCSGDSDDIPMDSNTSEVRQDSVKDKIIVAERTGEGLNKQSTTTSRVAAPPELVHEVDSLMIVPEQYSQSSQNRSREGSESSQPRRNGSAETESSVGSINFGDVVDAFGQKEFWKAQSTIIRQQKFFSKHVFELHRIIEVQRLLAKTSSLSLTYNEALEEEKALEEEDDILPMPTCPFADVPEVLEIPDRCPEAKRIQNFKSESAWQASPYAANPWTARVLSPLMYAPYSGPCSSGNGAYP